MVTKDDVLKMSRLAKIQLSESEIIYYQQHLDEILGYIKSLDEIILTSNNREDIFSYPSSEEPHLRDDEACQSSLSREELLKNAPSVDFDMFLVPQSRDRDS